MYCRYNNIIYPWLVNQPVQTRVLGIQTFMFILIHDSGKMHGIERLLKYNILKYKNVLKILIKKKKYNKRVQTI